MFKLPKPKKWTFIVFRDNSRPAIQFNLNRAILLLIPLCVVCLAMTTMWLTQAYHKKKQDHQQALAQIGENEELIESLHSDLVSLSIQTEEMQDKMKALQALEEEINQLTDLSNVEAPISHAKDPARRRNSVKLASSSERSGPEWENSSHTQPGESLGGDHYDVAPEETSSLTTRTKNNLETLHEQLPSLTERLEEARSNAEAYQERVRGTPSIWPTESKRVTSHFGYRRDPFTRTRSYHSGIDIGGAYNDPVYATADGKVTVAGYNPGMGNYITIDHPASGMQTRYLHLNKILVKQGDRVQKGDRIALLGSTGRSTGPHLHYEVMNDNKLIDPRPFMGSIADK